MPTVGEKLPGLLVEIDIDTVFGIPGVHTVELYRGLPGTGIRHITPRHEQGAGFMADGYWRASGRPAACFIISGPGMTNIATAMGQAYADSVPMLVISAVLNRAELGRGEGRLHEMKNQSQLASGVAEWSHTVMSPEELPTMLDRARSVFHSARPRPVHIEIPLDVIIGEAGDPSIATAPPAPPAPDPDAIARAANLLRRANRPLVILGGGASHSAEDQRALAEQLGAPVVLTVNGKGILPPNHPLLVGTLLPDVAVIEELAVADAVLAIGTELGETDTLLFGARPVIGGALTRVDIEADQLFRNATPTVGIVSDAGLAARALTASLGTVTAGNGPDRARALRSAALGRIDPAYAAHGRILTRLAEVFPDMIVAGDQTQPVYGSNLTYDAPRARSFFNASTGFGTLGYGLPAAFGAKLAAPDRKVISLIGDGGFQFTIAELATGVELGLPVPILLWNNHGYGEIKTYMRDRKIPEIGVDIYTPDFQAIARGFGAEATTAHSLDALVARLEAAFTATGPTLIELDDAEARNW